MFSFFANFVLAACFGSKHWLAQTTLVWIHCSCPALWLVTQLSLLLSINLSCSDVQDSDFHMVSVSLFQNTNIHEDSGARKMENFTFKAHRRFRHSTLHFWSRPYTHSVTLLKVSYDFFLLSQRIFPQIEQKRVGLPGSRTQLKSFRPLSIYLLHQGFDRELLLP